MFEAHLETCTQAGFLTGWARFADRPEPCVLRVLLGETVVARCVADRFRPDLFAADLGHGHHGFSARLLVDVAHGRYEVRILEEVSRTAPTNAASQMLAVPPNLRREAAPLSVDDLLSPEHGGWTAGDVARHLPELGLDRTLERIGPLAFVERAYGFCLGRGADAQAHEVYGRALQAGEIGPGSLIQLLLDSPERRASTAPLPGPYDPTFPF